MKKSEFEELLGTKNKKEQAEVIKAMQRALQMPVIDMVIRFDAAADQVIISIIGGRVAFDAANHILDLARKEIHRQEVIASIDQQAKQGDAPPPHLDLPAEDNGEPSPELNVPEAVAE
jgi:selenophosphate synthetase-related protein